MKPGSALPLLFASLAMACGDGEGRRSEEVKAVRDEPALPQPPPARPKTSKAVEKAERASKADAAGAADMLRDYYRLIEEGRHDEAWLLRETGPRGPDASAFVADMRRYRDYRATIGTPSRTAAAGEWIYVEVPVHIYGTMIDGKAFSSAGTVTLRRAVRDDGRGWRIYPGR